MIGTIKSGVGSPGKLWTGDRPAEGPAVISIIERRCVCGASTRKFRGAPLAGDSTAMLEAADFPVVLVTTGGVGSLVGTSPYPTPEQQEVRTAGLCCWNWSGRVGGYVIVAPIAVAGGYVAERDLPPAREGYRWLHTYSGDTLSEYVLLRAELASHAVSVIKLDGTCPPCREQAEKTIAAEAAACGAWDVPGVWISIPVGSRAARLHVSRCNGVLTGVTGCFTGTLDALEARVAEVHGDNEHGRGYRVVIAAARAAFEAQR